MKRKKFNLIAECLDSLLREHGFSRRKKNWYRQQEQALQVVNLQRSDFGEQFRVGLGILLRRLSENPAPKMCDCHITEQLERLAMLCEPRAKMPWLGKISEGKETDASVAGPTEPRFGGVVSFDLSPQDIDEVLQGGPAILQALDLDDPTLSDDERRRAVTETMLAIGLPFLDQCASIAKLKRCLRDGRLRGAGVDKIVYKLCKLPLP